ncbi:MAG: LacI family DNA-binding transcriptional regulator [Micrococcales bacterium]|nr:LacI family DNA-binding transcriptional regulator [Micrococcales bacterium]
MPAGVKDVAQRAGVSVGTVSNVLNRPDRVSAEVRDRVAQAIADLGYVRNAAARQLRAGRSTTIGLIVLDVRNPFFTDVARGAEDEAAEHGLSVTLGNSDENPAREAAYLDLFDEQRVHGVLISPIGDVAGRLDRLRARGIPAVLVDRAGADGRVSSVSVDDVAGGRMAAQHLLDTGRRRLAFVGGPPSIRQVVDRVEGARSALGGADRLEVLPTDALTVLEGRRIGQAIADRPPAARPDGIFAANDLIAMGLLQALAMRRDVEVPGEIALVGFDDIDFASAAVVPLTSVRQPSQLIGRTAMRLLLDEAADPGLAPRQVVFQPELVVRASSAPPP